MSLTVERVRELFDYNPDTGLMTRLKRTAQCTQVGQIIGCPTKGYLYAGVDGKNYMVHRLAWLHFYGKWPDGDIDHINHDKADNRIANLRDVSNVVNLQNMVRAKSNSSTGKLGVSAAKHHKTKPFRATITVNRRMTHLGYFGSEDEASAAYLRAKRSLHEGNTL